MERRGDLFGGGAVGVHDPDLGGAAAGGEEGDGLGVGGEAGVVVAALGGDGAGGAAGGGGDVDLAPGRVGFDVHDADGEGDEGAVGGEGGFGDALQLHHRLGGERRFRLGEGGRRKQDEEGNGEDAHTSNCSVRSSVLSGKAMGSGDRMGVGGPGLWRRDPLCRNGRTQQAGPGGSGAGLRTRPPMRVRRTSDSDMGRVQWCFQDQQP